jgi:hypothetical protein
MQEDLLHCRGTEYDGSNAMLAAVHRLTHSQLTADCRPHMSTSCRSAHDTASPHRQNHSGGRLVLSDYSGMQKEAPWPRRAEVRAMECYTCWLDYVTCASHT